MIFEKSRLTARLALATGALMVLAGCGGEGGGGGTTGLGTETARLEFVDGPADHVAGQVIPPFRVWAIDRFGRRATGLPPGTMTLDLLAPDGSVQISGFASVPVNFGQAIVTPTSTLPAGTGYSVRASFDGRNDSSPPFAVVSGPDVVRFTNASAGQVGLLVDGMNNIGLIGDSMHVATGTHQNVGVLNSGTQVQGTAVFAPDRRPEMIPFSWTSAVDTLTIALQPRVSRDVTVWVVVGNFATEQMRVGTALTAIDAAWFRERFGVTIGNVQFMDATSMEAQFGTFAVGLGAPFASISAGVGRTADQFNIYVVADVLQGGLSTAAFSELPGSAMAVNVDSLGLGAARLIMHEFGHNLGLQDAPDVEGFTIDGNVMKPVGTSLALTEGQTFRAHFGQLSPLRSIREDDNFGPITCQPVDANTHCPWLALRLWSESDGATSTAPRSSSRVPR